MGSLKLRASEVGSEASAEVKTIKNKTCETQVAADILKLSKVDNGIESLNREIDINDKNPHELAQKIDTKNNIYFYTYQIAEQVCKTKATDLSDLAQL